MGERRRCPGCRRLIKADPRVGERQQTCGRELCRQQYKREYNRQWRERNPDYFRASYAQQQERYGSRAEYQRQYRQSHPDYVERNAVYVQAWRQRRREAERTTAGPLGWDLHVSLGAECGGLVIDQVSHTSRDIALRLCDKESYRPVTPM